MSVWKCDPERKEERKKTRRERKNKKTTTRCRWRRVEAAPAKKEEGLMGRWDPSCLFSPSSDIASFAPTATQKAHEAFLSIGGGGESKRERQRTGRGADDDVVVAIRDVKPAAATGRQREEEGADVAGARAAARRDTAALVLSAMVFSSLLLGKRKEKKRACEETKRGSELYECEEERRVKGRDGRRVSPFQFFWSRFASG